MMMRPSLYFLPQVLADALFGPGTGPKDWALGGFFIAVAIGCFVGVGWLILQVIRGSKNVADRSLERIFFGVHALPFTPADGPSVKLKFTMYTMFLLWGEHRTIQVELPYARAKIVLAKLLKHNLMKGWLGHGGFFVPVLTIIEYRQQRKTLALQASRKLLE